MTLATFHHSHPINNFSVPGPPPRRRRQCVPPKPPTPRANFPLQAGRRGAGPGPPKPRSIAGGGAAARRRGEGAADFPGTARRGAQGGRGGAERGRGRGGSGLGRTRATPLTAGTFSGSAEGRQPARASSTETFSAARASSQGRFPFCLFPGLCAGCFLLPASHRRPTGARPPARSAPRTPDTSSSLHLGLPGGSAPALTLTLPRAPRATHPRRCPQGPRARAGRGAPYL